MQCTKYNRMQQTRCNDALCKHLVQQCIHAYCPKLGQFRSNAQNRLNWCRWHWMRTLIEKYFPGHFKWSSLQSIVFGITVEAIVLDRPSPVWIALLRDQRWRMRGEASLLCQDWPPQWGETHHRINKLIFSRKKLLIRARAGVSSSQEMVKTFLTLGLYLGS